MEGHGYDLMRVNWPLKGPNVERVHWVALMVEVGLSQFPGGRLEVSHLCNEKLCVNLMHLVLEPHARNLERIYCRLQGAYCGSNFPPFIFKVFLDEK